MGEKWRDHPGGVLGLECEAYLNGTLAEFWEEHGTAVPVWTWTNLLAHGSESRIHDSLVQGLEASPDGTQLAHRPLVPGVPGTCPRVRALHARGVPVDGAAAARVRVGGAPRGRGVDAASLGRHRGRVDPQPALDVGILSERRPRVAQRIAKLRNGALDPALHGPGQGGERQHPDAQQEVVKLPEIEGRREPVGSERA